MTSTCHGSWVHGGGSQHRQDAACLWPTCAACFPARGEHSCEWVALPAAPARRYTERAHEPCNRMYPAEGGDVTVSGLFTLASQSVVAAWPGRSQESAAFREKEKPKQAASLGWRCALGKGVQANEKQIQFCRSGVCHWACTARAGTCILPYAAAGPRAPLSAELLLVLLFARARLPSQTLPRIHTAYAAGNQLIPEDRWISS